MKGGRVNAPKKKSQLQPIPGISKTRLKKEKMIKKKTISSVPKPVKTRKVTGVLVTPKMNRTTYIGNLSDIISTAQNIIFEYYRLNPSLINVGIANTGGSPGFYPSDLVNYFLYLFWIKAQALGCIEGGLVNEIPTDLNLPCPAAWARWINLYLKAKIGDSYVQRAMIFSDPATTGNGAITGLGASPSNNYTQDVNFQLFPWLDNGTNRSLTLATGLTAQWTGVFTGATPFFSSNVLALLKAKISALVPCIDLDRISEWAPDLSGFSFPVIGGQSNEQAFANNYELVSFSDDYDPLTAIAATPFQTNVLSTSDSITIFCRSPCGLSAVQWSQDGVATTPGFVSLPQMLAWAFVRSDFPEDGKFTSTLRLYGVQIRSIGHIVAKPVEWGTFLAMFYAELQARVASNSTNAAILNALLSTVNANSGALPAPASGMAAGWASILQMLQQYATVVFTSHFQTHGNPGAAWMWGETATVPAQLAFCSNVNNLKVPWILGQYLKQLLPVAFYNRGLKSNMLVIPTADFSLCTLAKNYGGLSLGAAAPQAVQPGNTVSVVGSYNCRTPGAFSGSPSNYSTNLQPLGAGLIISTLNPSSGQPKISNFVSVATINGYSTAVVVGAVLSVFKNCVSPVLWSNISGLVKYIFGTSPTSTVKVSTTPMADNIPSGGASMLCSSVTANVGSNGVTFTVGQQQQIGQAVTDTVAVSLTFQQYWTPDVMQIEFPFTELEIATAFHMPSTLIVRTIAAPNLPPSRFFVAMDSSKNDNYALEFCSRMYNSEVSENYVLNLAALHNGKEVSGISTEKKQLDCFLNAAAGVLKQIGSALLHETDIVNHIVSIPCKIVAGRVAPVIGSKVCEGAGYEVQKLARSYFTRGRQNVIKMPIKLKG
jgi:hypothetical protein